jgi:hypothetical protein
MPDSEPTAVIPGAFIAKPLGAGLTTPVTPADGRALVSAPPSLPTRTSALSDSHSNCHGRPTAARCIFSSAPAPWAPSRRLRP